MQLNEILEENSIKAISQKTKISESNLESLVAGKFNTLQKTKALGFIAIIEREYHADLKQLREEALEYYSINKEDNTFSTIHYLDEDRKGKSKIVLVLALGLLVYASWYFLTQYDKKNLSGLIPFIDEATIENLVNRKEFEKADSITDLSIENKSAADLSIAKVTVEENEVMTIDNELNEVKADAHNTSHVVERIDEEDNSDARDSINEEDIVDQNISNTLQSVFIEPVNRLWFGLVNIETKERQHLSIDERYFVDVNEKTWLVATSSAPFSLVQGDKIEEFNDAREHYFKIDKNGILKLDKNEYVKLGGWHKW